MYQYRLHSHKTLVHAAKHADKDASWEVKKAYYRQSIARKEEVVSFLRQKNYHNLADNPHITVYTGIGSFAGPDVVEVGMAEGTLQLQAPRIFINTGAETVIPPIEGIQGNPRVYTSTSIMELTELPAQLVIVGGDTSDWNLLPCMLHSVRKSRCSRALPN